MAYNIYLYSAINQSVAEGFSRQLEWYADEDINVRMATQGGFTSAGIAMLTNLENHKGKITMYVDSEVYSMGAFMLLFADKVVMSEMGEVGFHKAAMKNPSETEQVSIDSLNDKFKSKMVARLGFAGQSLIDEVFEADIRNDVYLDAERCKSIGLVNEITPLNISQKAAFEKEFHKQMLMDKPPKQSSINKNNNKMEITSEELEKKLKSAKDEGFAQGKESGIALGTESEKARQANWNVFKEVDPEAVTAGIESGKDMSMAEQSAFLLKAKKADKKAELEDDSEEGAELGDGKEATEEERKKAETRKQIEASCGVKFEKE